MIFLENHKKSPKKRNDLKFRNDLWVSTVGDLPNFAYPYRGVSVSTTRGTGVKTRKHPPKSILQNKIKKYNYILYNIPLGFATGWTRVVP